MKNNLRIIGCILRIVGGSRDWLIFNEEDGYNGSNI